MSNHIKVGFYQLKKGVDKKIYLKIRDDNCGYPIDLLSIPFHYKDDLENILIPYGLILDRTEAIANQIFNDFKDRSLVLLCVIKGGYKFFSTLIEKIQAKNRNNDRVSIPLKINFVCLKRNENFKEYIELMDTDDLSFIKGKNVLLIENIVDTGVTLSTIKEFINNLEPLSVKTCCLLIKRGVNFEKNYPDYVGFEIPNRYVVGYALGLNEHFRDLNVIR